MNSPTVQDWTAWRVGQRVIRSDNSDKTGSVVEMGTRVKIKWDNGATSYYSARGAATNVCLVELDK